MGRWLMLSSCFFMLGSFTYGDATRAPDAKSLGGACASTHDCQKGTTCLGVDTVMGGQCSTGCNAAEACQQRFGDRALCIGADVCALGCSSSRECPAETVCNIYGWCERPRSE